MKRIKLHPLFLALILVLIIIGKWSLLCGTLLAVIMHEYFHFVAARMKGYRLFKLTLMPYGAVLYSEEQLSNDDEAFIAAAGPLSNLFLSICLIALWWLYPESYTYTMDFFRINLTIGLFNLLPAYPLDGSKFLLSVTKDRKRMLNIVKILGIVISIAFMTAFVVTAFFDINFTLGIAGILLFAGSFYSTGKERYVHLCSHISYLKDFTEPLEKKHIVINSEVEIKKLIKMLKPFSIYKIEVVDKSMNTIGIIKEHELEDIFLIEKSNTKIGDALKNLYINR